MSPNLNVVEHDFAHIRHVKFSHSEGTASREQATHTKGVEGFTTENAGGQTYRHTDVDDIKKRASMAGKQFFSIFEK